MSKAERAWMRDVLQRHVDQKGMQMEVADPVPFESQGFDFYCPVFGVEVRGAANVFPLVAKILPQEGMAFYLPSRLQTRNETLFYGEFLQFLLDTAVDGRKGMEPIEAIESLFPKLFCSHEDVDGQSLMALEDLRPLGFVHAPKVLDLEHVKLSIRHLGKIHALSYIAKKKNPKGFFDFVKRFNRWEKEMCEELTVLISGMTQFVVDLFRAAYPEDAIKYAGRLAKIDAAVDAFVDFLEPEEPLAVFCHGDYNRNNILFSYDDGGRPTSFKVIDFQLATYSSPAIDVGLLLFLSTSPEVRDGHWDELFDDYRSSLLDTMELSLGCPRDVLEAEYSKELMSRDFAKHSLHPFLITNYFLPETIMNPEESRKLMSECPQELNSENIEVRKRHCSEEVRNRLAVLLKVLLERNIL